MPSAAVSYNRLRLDLDTPLWRAGLHLLKFTAPAIPTARSISESGSALRRAGTSTLCGEEYPDVRLGYCPRCGRH